MRFSIVATHYDLTVTDKEFQRFLDSLKNQTFKDFEVIVLHDGPRNRREKVNSEGLNITFIDTLFRANTFGHNLRTEGIKLAKGEYILNTNSDNYYNADALDILNRNIMGGINVYSMDILMRGLNQNGTQIWYDTPRNNNKVLFLSGEYIRHGSVDMMQVIVHRDIWKEINYWYRIDEESDGKIYERIISRHPYKYINSIIGQHY